MRYSSPHKQFIFQSYSFDEISKTATFSYSFDGQRNFKESIEFPEVNEYNHHAFDQAMQLAFIVIGTSYYKAFPTKDVQFHKGQLDEWQALFAKQVYTEGLSQFIYENNLNIDAIARFMPSTEDLNIVDTDYVGEGILALQSGGKDSLLVAEILKTSGNEYSILNISSSAVYPKVLDSIEKKIYHIKRRIDIEALTLAAEQGALNGHVPVTYIILAISLMQAVLLGKSHIISAIGHEGAEPHAYVDNMPVNHQWSKTWESELLFAEYVDRYISPNIKVGSIIRSMTELKIAEQFVKYNWDKYGTLFSSCNRYNYKQGEEKSELGWCGECPKCANNFLLFSPFVEPSELTAVFDGQNLFSKPMLVETWKGLLGIGDALKPFECVGEIAELRLAYQMARDAWGAHTYELPFDVPHSSYDYQHSFPMQPWATKLLS